MTDLNFVAIAVAVVVAFILSGAYYAALGARLTRLSPAYADDSSRSAGATVVVELVRNGVLVFVVAGIAAGLRLDGVAQALLLALALWLAFPAVLLAGSVFHERVPPLLATIHAGDWVLKLVAITGIVTLWR